MLMVCIAFVTGPWPGCLCSLDRGLAGCVHWTVVGLVVFTGPWPCWLRSLDRDQADCVHWTVSWMVVLTGPWPGWSCSLEHVRLGLFTILNNSNIVMFTVSRSNWVSLFACNLLFSWYKIIDHSHYIVIHVTWYNMTTYCVTWCHTFSHVMMFTAHINSVQMVKISFSKCEQDILSRVMMCDVRWYHTYLVTWNDVFNHVTWGIWYAVPMTTLLPCIISVQRSQP